MNNNNRENMYARLRDLVRIHNIFEYEIYTFLELTSLHIMSYHSVDILINLHIITYHSVDILTIITIKYFICFNDHHDQIFYTNVKMQSCITYICANIYIQ